METTISDWVMGLSAMAAIICIYFFPTGVAYQRKHHNLLAIGILNVFAGWTFIGWVGSLVWAVTAVKKDTAQPDS